MAGSGGLEQRRRATLDIEALRHAWQDKPQWTVLQAAFGNGAQFIAAWHAWRIDPRRPRMLHFVGIAQPSFSAEDIVGAPALDPGLKSLAAELAAQCWGMLPGTHRLVFESGRVLLTLHVGDADGVLQRERIRADTVLSPHPLLARQTNDATAPGATTPAHCVVIGAGIAGAAVARSLAMRGWRVTVLDAASHPAAGASSLPAGLLAPHFSPDDAMLSRLSRAGVRATLGDAHRLLKEGRDWAPCGAMERRSSAPGESALSSAGAAWTRSPSTESLAAVGEGAWLWHERSAWIKPAALVHAWLASSGVTWRGNAKVATIEREDGAWAVRDEHGATLAQAPLVVVAAALESATLLRHAPPLTPVRGQVTWGPLDAADQFPAFAVNGNGHFIAGVPHEGGTAWLCGSTFDRGETTTEPRAADHARNLNRLGELLSHVAQQLAPRFNDGAVNAWTGVRCASATRRPLVGELEPGLWMSTAMGSRGLTFAVLCAEILAARLHGEPLPVEQRLADALMPPATPHGPAGAR